MSQDSTAVKTWYSESARPFLEKWSADRVGPLDTELARLGRLEDASIKKYQACFLGNSGVGKSTLINILVDDTAAVLPQGGVGPLTALATRVQWSETPYFEVTYHGWQKLNQLLFALERTLDRANASNAGGGDSDIELSPEDKQELEAAIEENDSIASEGPSSVLEAYTRQARLMVCGNQFEGDDRDISYMTSALRLALGLRPRLPVTLYPEDAKRVARLREAIDNARKSVTTRVEALNGNEGVFLHNLEEHAAGFLAPLIKTIEVGWNAPVLGEGLVLVDLPGLGIANDEYRRVTQEEIRRARTVVIVVDRSGVTEASAQLLRETGFLNALLYDDAESEPISLIVAAVKLDLSADAERMNDKALGRGTGRRWTDYFDEVCEKAIAMLRGQLHDELKKIADEGSQEIRADKDQVVAKLLGNLKVFPVAALEHRKFYLQDEDERARIKEPEQSRIPSFRDALLTSARERNLLIDRRLADQVAALGRLASAGIAVVKESWEEDGRAEAEAEELRGELTDFLAPRKRELEKIAAKYQEFLSETMKSEIEKAVLQATVAAGKDIRRTLKRYDEYNWKTLQAAVRRGGAYVGARRVDLPMDFALNLEEHLVVVWKEGILKPLRTRTRELGETYAEMVEEVVAWARKQGARVNAQLVEALSKEIKEQVKQFERVGRELVDDLRDGVKQQLLDRISTTLQKRCLKFVTEKLAEGPGVKLRMLSFFAEDLAEAVMAAGTTVALTVLVKNYEVIRIEISELNRRHENPLDEAAAQIVDRHEGNARRADKKKRNEVLEAATAVLSAYPLGIDS